MDFRFYFPQCTDGDLDDLSAVAMRLSLRCPILGSWLFGELRRETDRRAAEATGMPLDVRLPVAPNLLPDEVADALRAATSLSYGVQNPRVGKFVDELVLYLTARAGFLLKNPPPAEEHPEPKTDVPRGSLESLARRYGQSRVEQIAKRVGINLT